MINITKFMFKYHPTYGKILLGRFKKINNVPAKKNQTSTKL